MTAVLYDAGKAAADDAEVETVLEPIAQRIAQLSSDARLAGRVITRPHPLLAAVKKDNFVVLLVPAVVWDRGREVLKPFTPKFAEGGAMLVLLGRPTEPDLAQALN